MIAGAIRDLGKKGTRRAASVANASATILSLPVAHSLINRIFEEAGHRGLSCEFANLLERAAAAEPFACRRLAEIAKAVAPDISPPRGRQISVATAMHELFLEMLCSSGKSAAYTWNDEQEDFVDEMTHPTAEWIARQLTEACGWDPAPRYLIRDRDSAYGEIFKRRLHAMGIRDRLTAPCSPWQSGWAERLIGSIRRECRDHVVCSASGICAMCFFLTSRMTMMRGLTSL